MGEGKRLHCWEYLQHALCLSERSCGGDSSDNQPTEAADFLCLEAVVQMGRRIIWNINYGIITCGPIRGQRRNRAVKWTRRFPIV